MTEFKKTGILRDPRIRRRVLSLVLVGLIPIGVSSCYGTFPLTRALYKINGGITESKWVHTIVLWGLVFFQVYSITAFVDFVLLNLIEFWSGDEIDIAQTYEQDDGTMVALETSEDGETLTMTVSREGEVLAERRFVRLGDGRTAVYTEKADELVGMVSRGEDGGFFLEDYRTGETRTLTRGNIEELRAAVVQ